MTQSPAARAPIDDYHPRLSGMRLIQICGVLLVIVLALVGISRTIGLDLYAFEAVIDEVRREKLPADGRSNLSGGAASITYTAGPSLNEMITDEDWGEGPNDGARWELRTPVLKGYNTVSLSHYIYVPALDNPAAVDNFVAKKDVEHEQMAGKPVGHEEITVDGRNGYLWEYEGRSGYWQYAAWFPQPVHTVRVECIAKRQRARFVQLCDETMRTLKFNQ